MFESLPSSSEAVFAAEPLNPLDSGWSLISGRPPSLNGRRRSPGAWPKIGASCSSPRDNAQASAQKASQSKLLRVQPPPPGRRGPGGRPGAAFRPWPSTLKTKNGFLKKRALSAPGPKKRSFGRPHPFRGVSEQSAEGKGRKKEHQKTFKAATEVKAEFGGGLRSSGGGGAWLEWAGQELGQ